MTKLTLRRRDFLTIAGGAVCVSNAAYSAGSFTWEAMSLTVKARLA